MNKNTKLFIFFIIFIGIIFSFFQKKYLISIFLTLLSFIPLLFFFRNEFLILAFFKMNQKNMNKVNEYLKKIKNPKKQLTKNQIPYFYFLKGVLYSEKNIQRSEFYMKKSINSGLKNKQNLAIANLSLAISSLSKGDKYATKFFLKEAKKIDSSGILKEQIQIIKNKMKKINNNINNQNPFTRRNF